MKKIIICGIPMKENVDEVVYVSEDKSIPAADRPVRYPVNAFLEETLKPSDEVKIVLLVKQDEYGNHEKNIEYFKTELKQANSQIGASISYSVIDTDFSQNKAVHEKLMGDLVDEFDIGAHIISIFWCKGWFQRKVRIKCDIVHLRGCLRSPLPV